MKKSFKAVEAKRRLIAGGIIVGIDPGKASQLSVVLELNGFQMGNPDS